MVSAVIILFWFSLYPTDMWMPEFFLEWLPANLQDKPLMQEVVLKNQTLWFGLIVLTGIIISGVAIANAK
jgi:hypothetical protein